MARLKVPAETANAEGEKEKGGLDGDGRDEDGRGPSRKGNRLALLVLPLTGTANYADNIREVRRACGANHGAAALVSWSPRSYGR